MLKKKNCWFQTLKREDFQFSLVLYEPESHYVLNSCFDKACILQLPPFADILLKFISNDEVFGRIIVKEYICELQWSSPFQTEFPANHTET